MLIVVAISQRAAGDVMDSTSTNNFPAKEHDVLVLAINPLCPHGSGNLSMGDLEDLPPMCSKDYVGPHPSIVCPKHDYDFNLVTGESSRCHLVAQTWRCEVFPKEEGRTGQDWVGVWMEKVGKDGETYAWKVKEVKELLGGRVVVKEESIPVPTPVSST